jgi:uncharacterized membrane protein
MKDIEISAEILEEKTEHIHHRFKKRFKSKWHEKGFFLIIAVLMFFWFGLTLIETGARLVHALLNFFKNRGLNQKLRTSLLTIPFSLMFGFAFLAGIIKKEWTLSLLEKIEHLCANMTSTPLKIVQSFLRSIRTS